jgi:hypothetical protein
MASKSSAGERRQRIRDEFWATEDAWTGEDEKGWFRAPRTIPLVLALIASKELSGNTDPTRVYLELIARQIDGGVVEIEHEADHAFAAGYEGARATRTWQERMRLLEKLGFIKIKAIGNHTFKYVLIVHPTTAIHCLKEQGKIPQKLWDAYRDRQIQTKEPSYSERQLLVPSKVVPMEKRKQA